MFVCVCALFGLVSPLRYQTILGVEGFRKGMDLYFLRHDGKAVTSEDFLAAMADANDVDLSQFERWYSQVGRGRLCRRALSLL